MRVFVTGGSGFIGSAVIPELLEAGHQVVAIARSDASEAALKKAGVDVRRASLLDVDVLRAGALEADGVIHLGHSHDFTKMPEAAAMERGALEAMGEALVDTGKPLAFASGLLGMSPGRLALETDEATSTLQPRQHGHRAARALAQRGVRVVAVRFAPTVHGPGDKGFMAHMLRCARTHGVSPYVGDGSQRWPAVHRLDAGRLVRLALEKAKAGSAVHAVGEEGLSVRTIAEAIGRHLNLPVTSIAAGEAAMAHFGFLGAFVALDSPASSKITQEALSWTPTHPGLIEDISAGHYSAR